VFVHGLNPSGRLNHAYQTWTHADNTIPWPYELLPEDFPQARISIFGYNSSVTRGGSQARISDHASNLLDWLQGKREGGDGVSLEFLVSSESIIQKVNFWQSAKNTAHAPRRLTNNRTTLKFQ
jgi:hypothetical protein